MPLTRASEGRFGVAMTGAGQAPNVVVHIATPDAASLSHRPDRTRGSERAAGFLTISSGQGRFVAFWAMNPAVLKEKSR